MIILRLRGGLGNQIFQCIHALQTATTDEKIVTDYSHFFKTFEKDYAGSDFLIKQVLAESHLKQFKFIKMPPLLSNIFWKTAELFNICNLKNKIQLLNGYFHEASLYPDSLEISKYFDVKSNFSMREINADAVLIHVRKGDYVNTVNSKIYYSCNADYYKKCTDLMIKKIPNAKFYVVSNDNEWVRNNFTFLTNYNLIENTDTIETFKAMSLFSNFILCNSTFSWWPAFLAKNPYVFVPKMWFLDVSKNTNLYPVNWNQI